MTDHQLWLPGSNPPTKRIRFCCKSLKIKRNTSKINGNPANPKTPKIFLAKPLKQDISLTLYEKNSKTYTQCNPASIQSCSQLSNRVAFMRLYCEAKTDRNRTCNVCQQQRPVTPRWWYSRCQWRIQGVLRPWPPSVQAIQFGLTWAKKKLWQATRAGLNWSKNE